MRDGRTPGAASEGPVLDLLLNVLGALDADAVSWCYWKSSRRLPEVLAGEADADLLIARSDQHRAHGILLSCGFKLFSSIARTAHPAVASFLGYDEPSGRIVHLHVHTRLVVGGKLLKSHRLPWEDRVLARAVRHPALPVRTLDPETEAVLLVSRALLELRRSDPIVWRDWRPTLEKFALDLTSLRQRVDRLALRERASELIGGSLADDIVDAFWTSAPLHRQSRLRRRLSTRLAPHREYNAFEKRLRGAGRARDWLLAGLNKRVLHVARPWNRSAPGGGLVIAVLGVDGSGKTTVVAALREWLGAEVDVLPIYLGTGGGRPSLLLWPLKLAVPLISRLLPRKPRGSSHGAVSDRDPGRLYAALLTIWATVLAVEKRRKLLAAHRGATRGMVVITDRYPQDSIPGFNDGPLLTRLRRVPGLLRRFEARSYALANTLPPDLAIKLVATAELLGRREPDMDKAVIAQRLDQLRALSFPGSAVVRIDATQPLSDVLAAVKREVWRAL